NPGRSTVRKTSNRPKVGTPGPLAVSRLVQKDSHTTPVRQLNRLFTINFCQTHRRLSLERLNFHPAPIRGNVLSANAMVTEGSSAKDAIAVTPADEHVY